MASRRHSRHILLQRLTISASPFPSLCPAGSGEGQEGLVPSLPGRGFILGVWYWKEVFFCSRLCQSRYTLLLLLLLRCCCCRRRHYCLVYTSSCLLSSHQRGPVWRSSPGTISTSPPVVALERWHNSPIPSHPIQSYSSNVLLCSCTVVCATPSVFPVEVPHFSHVRCDGCTCGATTALCAESDANHDRLCQGPNDMTFSPRVHRSTLP